MDFQWLYIANNPSNKENPIPTSNKDLLIPCLTLISAINPNSNKPYKLLRNLNAQQSQLAKEVIGV